MSDPLPEYAVWFRGKPACPCLAEWLPEYERELQRRGLLVGSLTIYQLIGGASASAGTHSKGGAFDLIDLSGDLEVWVARQMGADATWTRPYNWDSRGGMAHNHGVLRGCPHNGPAAYQIDAVDDGYNGLGSGGRGGPDTGPRPLSGRTWREGIKWAKAQQKEAWDEMASKQEIKELLVEEVRKPLAQLARQLAGKTRARIARFEAESEASIAELEQLATDLAAQSATKEQAAKILVRTKAMRERLGTLVRDLEQDDIDTEETP